MPNLFDPLTVRSITLRNRIGVSPMCMYSSDDGVANDWHFVHLGSRAVGGAALVVAEATAVSPEGRISPGDAGIWAEKHIEPLAKINRFVKAQGAVPGIQIAHAGRKGSAARPWEGGASLSDAAGGWTTFAPSAVAFGDELSRVPKALTAEEIKKVQQDFVAAAKRALEAGYEWLEIHGAHGYLAHEFLSPISNRRTDNYGGSFENRIRFILETAKAVRAAWPEKLPLGIRLSCSDWVEGGWTIDETVELARRLKTEGIDLIDCSSGGTTPNAKIPVGPGYQVHFAERVKKEAGVLTAAVGMIREPHQADKIIADGQADLIMMAREFLRDPYWPYHAAKELNQRDRLAPPKQYGRAL